MNLPLDSKDKSPLYIAIESKNLAMVELLIKHGAKINLPGDYKPLPQAVKQGSLEIVQHLIKAEPNHKKITGDYNMSLLMIASYEGH